MINVNDIKNKYHAGMKVKLIHMDDRQAPPSGTLGTVLGVDDIGSILVRWETGSSLNLIPEVDEFKVVGRLCPKCGNEYSEPPAISRKDNRTEICPMCGTIEALLEYGLGESDIEQIVERIFENM